MKNNKKPLTVYKPKSTHWILSLALIFSACAQKSSVPTLETYTAPKINHAQLDTFQGRGKITLTDKDNHQTVAFQAVGQCDQGVHMQWSVLGVSVAALWMQDKLAYIYIPKENTVYKMPAQKMLLPWAEAHWTHTQMLASFCYDLRQVQHWGNIDLTWAMTSDSAMQIIEKVQWLESKTSIKYMQFPIGQRYPRRIIWQSGDQQAVMLTWKNIQKNVSLDSALWSPTWPEDALIVEIEEPFSIWTKTR